MRLSNFRQSCSSAIALPSLALLLSISFTLFAEPVFADFSINPSITVSEEYNDNVFESNYKRTDYITRMMPGIAFTYVMPFWDWNVSYNYDYRYYARNSRNNDDTHNLVASGLIRIIDDFLLLDINDTYSRISLDVSRDRTQEGLFVDQSDSNNFTASPYLQFHPTSLTTIKTGYRYTNLWYSDPTGVDRRDHIGYIDAAYLYSSKLTLNANHTYTHENSTEPFDRHISYIGGRYEYAPRSFILAQGGMAFISPKYSSDTKRPYWNVGLTHSFDHSSLSLTSIVQYPIDPTSGVTREVDYTISYTKELNRGTLGANFSYTDYSGTSIDVNKRYGGGVTASYDLTTNLNSALSCTVDKYDHSLTNSYTRRILVNPSLTYSFPHEFTIALNYVFVDSYSPVTSTDRYQANRVSFEIRKSFGREVERLRTTDNN